MLKNDAAPRGVPVTVCAVRGTDADITLLFGHPAASPTGGSADLVVSHRIALTPYAAKRLAQMLEQGIEEHERRFGATTPA